ncbi:hypothetical protein [Dokdonella sp.]|uniref:hypothetical protein n=1 Tax=Dokdonella sp. TaxID=2291710 RepID=UPI002DD62DED|nr:hypothetical protein [Dokdonella sp.]
MKMRIARRRALGLLAEGAVEIQGDAQVVDGLKFAPAVNTPEVIEAVAFVNANMRNIRSFLEVRAANAVLEAWSAQGGASSALGLPISKDLTPRREGAITYFDFRGGTVSLDDLRHLDTMTTKVGRTAELWFVGLECLHRQEADDDEISVSYGTLVPSSLKIETQYSYFEGIGPADQRIRTAAVPIYTGPPAAMVIPVVAVERDTGDKAGKLQNGLRSALDAGAKRLGTEVGLPPGEIAGYLEEELGLKEEFLEYIWDEFADWFIGLLGLPDDPLGQGALVITEADCLTPPPSQRAVHPPDQKTVDYTHKVFLENADDDLAYNFYFRYVVKDA